MGHAPFSEYNGPLTWILNLEAGDSQDEGTGK